MFIKNMRWLATSFKNASGERVNHIIPVMLCCTFSVVNSFCCVVNLCLLCLDFILLCTTGPPYKSLNEVVLYIPVNTNKLKQM